jgi:hypothetical protein
MADNKARSAVIATHVSLSFNAQHISSKRGSFCLISIPIAACPTHGSISSTVRSVAQRFVGQSGPDSLPVASTVKPNRFKPAAARIVASKAGFAETFRKRVPTLPRNAIVLSVGEIAFNCAARRVLLVPIVAWRGN